MGFLSKFFWKVFNKSLSSSLVHPSDILSVLISSDFMVSSILVFDIVISSPGEGSTRINFDFLIYFNEKEIILFHQLILMTKKKIEKNKVTRAM